MIGQTQVTDPLMTALRTNRVNHAYLFSGPRGCGKTTSARILARCLNCAEGPTDTPCGVCPSCIELSRDGSGSLDVVEIDAASHNGVDDARELRERAVFAPARDRYKIFILDEAHMVTPQGFNALLKLVEEPPEHVKFIFATTEPEKVIGTIRSRTHHYPFRLIPPALMLDYVEHMASLEGVTVEPGVLALVVRAGGGSARDTLSLLDQLIAGSEGDVVTYVRAVALLGFTHAALLDEVVDALAARDAGAVFSGVDRVIQTGQDPRRFVEDLLERLRDLIVVGAAGPVAKSVLRGMDEAEVARLETQARGFGQRTLSNLADIVNAGLTDMVGATSPKLQLELMVGRLLVEVAVASDARRAPDDAGGRVAPIAPLATEAPREHSSAAPGTDAPKTPAPQASTSPPAEKIAPTTQAMLTAWPAVLDHLQSANRMAWIVVSTASLRDFDGDVATLVFPSEKDASSFRPQKGVPGGVHELLRQSISAVAGVEPKFRVSVDGTPTAAVDTVPVKNAGDADSAAGGDGVDAPASSAQQAATQEKPSPVTVPEQPGDDWAVAAIPHDESGPIPDITPKTVMPAEAHQSQDDGRYGEAVVRDVLGAVLIKDERTAPIDTDTPTDTGAQQLPDVPEA